MFKFVGIVMAFAPFGIGAAIAVTVGQSGIGVLKNLGILVLTLYGALIVFVAVRARSGRAHLPHPDRAVLEDGARAVADRVLDGVVRSGAAAARCRRWRRSASRGALLRS